jgi:hypothetical protein
MSKGANSEDNYRTSIVLFSDPSTDMKFQVSRFQSLSVIDRAWDASKDCICGASDPAITGHLSPVSRLRIGHAQIGWLDPKETTLARLLDPHLKSSSCIDWAMSQERPKLLCRRMGQTLMAQHTLASATSPGRRLLAEHLRSECSRPRALVQALRTGLPSGTTQRPWKSQHLQYYLQCQEIAPTRQRSHSIHPIVWK